MKLFGASANAPSYKFACIEINSAGEDYSPKFTSPPLLLIDLKYLAIARPSTCLTALISLLPLGPVVGPYVTS